MSYRVSLEECRRIVSNARAVGYKFPPWGGDGNGKFVATVELGGARVAEYPGLGKGADTPENVARIEHALLHAS